MNKVGIVIGSVTLMLIVGGVFLFSRPPKLLELPNYDSSKLVYFWGNGCPHCAIVDEFVESWDKKDEIEIQKFEVWYDNNNQALMTKLASEICKIPANNLSVPLLVRPDGTCLNGDQPIIEYYKSL